MADPNFNTKRGASNDTKARLRKSTEKLKKSLLKLYTDKQKSQSPKLNKPNNQRSNSRLNGIIEENYSYPMISSHKNSNYYTVEDLDTAKRANSKNNKKSSKPDAKKKQNSTVEDNGLGVYQMKKKYMEKVKKSQNN